MTQGSKLECPGLLGRWPYAPDPCARHPRGACCKVSVDAARPKFPPFPSSCTPVSNNQCTLIRKTASQRRAREEPSQQCLPPRSLSRTAIEHQRSHCREPLHAQTARSPCQSVQHGIRFDDGAEAASVHHSASREQGPRAHCALGPAPDLQAVRSPCATTTCLWKPAPPCHLVAGPFFLNRQAVDVAASCCFQLMTHSPV